MTLRTGGPQIPPELDSRHVSRDVATFCFAKKAVSENSQAKIREICVIRAVNKEEIPPDLRIKLRRGRRFRSE